MSCRVCVHRRGEAKRSTCYFALYMFLFSLMSPIGTFAFCAPAYTQEQPIMRKRLYTQISDLQHEIAHPPYWLSGINAARAARAGTPYFTEMSTIVPWRDDYYSTLGSSHLS